MGRVKRKENGMGVLESSAASLLTLDLEGVSEDLKAFDRWVVWEAEWDNPLLVTETCDWTLRPYCALTGRPASATEPGTWAPFEVAVAAYKQRGSTGIAFVLTGQEPLVAIELMDGLNADGTTTQEAARRIEQMNSWTEILPSGRGLFILTRGHLPPGGRGRNGLQLSECDHILPITGRRLEGTLARIEERQVEIETLHREAFPSPPIRRSFTIPSAPPSGDAELLSVAFGATNGARIERLYRGDTAVVPGDRNAADLALCSMLGFYIGDDPVRLDRLFRGSALYRRKWDERHYSDGSTYGQAIVTKALEGCLLFYKYPENHDEKREPQARVKEPHTNGEGRILALPTPSPTPMFAFAAPATGSAVDPLVVAERQGRAEGLARREIVLNAHEAAEMLKISTHMLRRTIHPWRRFGESARGDRWLLSQILCGEPFL